MSGLYRHSGQNRVRRKCDHRESRQDNRRLEHLDEIQRAFPISRQSHKAPESQMRSERDMQYRKAPLRPLVFLAAAYTRAMQTGHKAIHIWIADATLFSLNGGCDGWPMRVIQPHFRVADV